MMQEVRSDLQGAAESLGLNIKDVRIRRTDLTREVSQQTYQRMKAERLAEAELIRARGNEEGQRRRAIADRQVVEIVSEAQRDSEIIRGEGDAQRNRLFAEAFQRDPGFSSSIARCVPMWGRWATRVTTMVLSPDSQFFRFFNQSNAPQPGAPALAAPTAPGTTGNP